MSTAKDCYALLQAIVTRRDPFCRRPGCHRPTSAGHHIFKRDRMASAFDPQFCVGLCAHCHTSWAHGQPDEFRAWVIGWMGESEYYDALRTSHSIVKHQDLNEIHRLLSIELYRLK